MPGFLDYYRQFEELPPEEVSRTLRARRDKQREGALSRVAPLDLSGTGWHEPPHPEAVNAATFALRRTLNAYPDASASEVVAARHGLGPEQVVLGHGAGELLAAACVALLTAGDEALVAWPGWLRIPGLIEAAGARPVPVALTGDGAPDPAALLAAVGPATRMLVLCSPNDPTGAALTRAQVRALCAGVPEHVTVVVDEALAELRADGEDAAALAAQLGNLLVVRSFSKGHALAGLRAGAALGAPELVARLEPWGGIGAPVQAAVAWAAGDGGAHAVARRREQAGHDRHRLAAALAGSALRFTPAPVPFAWLASATETGSELATRLAARQIYVAPGRAWGDERHVRVSLRGPAAVDQLARALLER